MILWDLKGLNYLKFLLRTFDKSINFKKKQNKEIYLAIPSLKDNEKKNNNTKNL